ncbi:MAG: hypothetical protein BAJALOKI3v1_50137 [Promethearchaeota archaeon]|nr:MAG: hypothetical protein BAJALOKI3v1_50137 [Candidatus Lokiarchaeota archaeon]
MNPRIIVLLRKKHDTTLGLIKTGSLDVTISKIITVSNTNILKGIVFNNTNIINGITIKATD